MEKLIHTFRRNFASDKLMERRAIYMSAEAPKPAPEAKIEGAEKPVTTPETVLTAQEKYEKERDDLLATARKIAEDPASTPVMKEAARKAMQAIAEQAEKPRSLDDKQIQEFRARINEILYAPKIKEYEAKRDALRKQADEKYKVWFDEIEKAVSNIIRSPAYKNLSASGKENLTKIQELWRGKINAAMAKNLPYIFGAEGLPKTAAIKPESFDDPNSKLSEESAKINGDDNDVLKALDDITREYSMSAQAAALEDIASGPGVSRENLQMNLDVHFTEVIAKINEKIDKALPIDGKNKKENKANEAARKDAKERANLYLEDAHNQIAIIGYDEAGAGKRAVVLAWLRDRMNALLEDPQNPNPTFEYSASMHLAKANKMDTTEQGRRFLSTLDITVPAEKKPESETKPEDVPAEAAPAQAEKPLSPAEQLRKDTWETAKQSPSEYRVPIFEIMMNADSPQGAKFMYRVNKTDYNFSVVKGPEGYNLQYPGGFFAYKDKPTMIKEIQEGIVSQKLMYSIMKSQNSFDNYRNKVGETYNLHPSQDGRTVSFDLDWKNLAERSGNAHVEATARPHGAIEYRIIRHQVGPHDENESAGRAGSFDDLMKQMAHLKTWAETDKYKREPSEFKREENYRAITNPTNYYSRADRIGRPVYFGIQSDDTVKMYLDWGGGTDKNVERNPFIQVSTRPDGKIDCYFIYKPLMVGEHTICDNFQAMEAAIYKYKVRAKIETSAVANPDTVTDYVGLRIAEQRVEGRPANPETADKGPRLPLGAKGHRTETASADEGAEPQKPEKAAEPVAENGKEKKEQPAKPKAPERKTETVDKYAEKITDAKTIMDFRYALFDAYYNGNGVEKKPAFQKALGEKLAKDEDLAKEMKLPEDARNAYQVQIKTMEEYISTLKKGQIADDTIKKFVMDNMRIRPSA